ncbi:hypothetical protein ACG7TL_004820 [Trametes sanguinea]
MPSGANLHHVVICPGKQQPTTSVSAPLIKPQTSAVATETRSTDGAVADTQTSPVSGPASSSIEGSNERPLRTLASLKWPYVPEESAFPDPLKRDDPKPLQLHHYEAIATSPSIRRVLAQNPRLREILRKIDGLRGDERELALHEALGVGDSKGKILVGHESEEDQKALRDLAEAVEAAVRGGKHDVLGLDWGD